MQVSVRAGIKRHAWFPFLWRATPYGRIFCVIYGTVSKMKGLVCTYGSGRGNVQHYQYGLRFRSLINTRHIQNKWQTTRSCLVLFQILKQRDRCATLYGNRHDAFRRWSCLTLKLVRVEHERMVCCCTVENRNGQWCSSGDFYSDGMLFQVRMECKNPISSL